MIGSGLIGPGLLGAVLSLFTMILTIFFLPETAPIKTGKTIFGDLNLINTFKNNNKESGIKVNSINEKRSIWKNRTARVLLIQWAFHTMAFMIFMANITLFANFKFGLTSELLGLLLTLLGIFQVFVRLVIFYPLLKKLGERLMPKIGLGLYIILFFFIGFVQTEWQFIIILLAHSFATSTVRGILSGFLSRSVDPRDQGKIQGLNTGLDTFAQFLGPIIGGLVLTLLPLWFYGIIPSLLSILPFIIVFIPLEFKYEKQDSNHVMR